MKPRIGGKYRNQFDLDKQVYKVEKVDEAKDLVWLKALENESFKSKVPLSSFGEFFWEVTSNKTKVELFFLVEYGTDQHIERRHLFKTNEEAKNFCKKELYLTYNRKNGFWQGDDRHEGAQIITLVLESNNKQ